jgi:hypothetical protein
MTAEVSPGAAGASDSLDSPGVERADPTEWSVRSSFGAIVSPRQQQFTAARQVRRPKGLSGGFGHIQRASENLLRLGRKDLMIRVHFLHPIN